MDVEEHRDLKLLEAVHEDSRVTQRSLSSKLGIALGLTNIYLKRLVRKGYIKGIIGLPANLFYGTGIPACIVVIDKHGAQARKGVFMIDANAGFMKDGPKNRLREMDTHRIVDVFTRLQEVPKYARMVSVDEIEKNDFNLNLPRYIDSQEPEDLQDIAGHLLGGIPVRDVDALQTYWDVCPSLRSALFRDLRPGYVELAVDASEIRSSIYGNTEFVAFIVRMHKHFDVWSSATSTALKALEPGFDPKELIASLGESLLAHYADQPLVDAYDVYQHLMDYWDTTMQDDAYLIAADGWKAEPYRVIEKDKKGKERDRGWTCDLVPKELLIEHYFAEEQAAFLESVKLSESADGRLSELVLDQSGEEGVFAEFEHVTRGAVAARIREIVDGGGMESELTLLERWQ